MSKTYRRNDSRRPKWSKYSDKKSRKQREMDSGDYKHRPRSSSQDYPEDVIENMSGQ